MNFLETPIPGLLIIEPRIFEDDRGYFMETHHKEKFAAHGILDTFIQQNQSRSKRGVLRGLHFQKPPFEQGKLVRVTRGEVFDVAVDIRPGSKTFGKHFTVILSEENRRMVYIPPGFAHGFQALSPFADLLYSCSCLYNRASELGIAWNDPQLRIEWPLVEPILLEKDRLLPPLNRISA